MNQLDDETRVRVLACICEGMGIRPTSRVTGVAKNTIQRLLRDVGRACHLLEQRRFVRLPCEDIQCDEVWAFCYAREKNVPAEHKGEWGYGDVWTWTALDTKTKLMVAWKLGPRDAGTGVELLDSLAYRTRIDESQPVQLSTDGFNGYTNGVSRYLMIRGEGLDWGTIVKTYQTPNGLWDARYNRYEQPAVTHVKRRVKCGNPDEERISTSLVERTNLGLRMHCRKYTRLTNGHAKKVQNLAFSLALTFAYYNWVKPHESLGGRTPAMAAGLSNRRWTLYDIVALIKPDDRRMIGRGPTSQDSN